MEYLLGASVMFVTLAFCFSAELIVKYSTRPKTIEDKLVDDLIDDKITFEEFEKRLYDLAQKEKKEKIKKERIKKLKKINDESR